MKIAPIVLAIVVLLVSLFVGHPFMLGLSGRVGELVFQRSLHPGMTRSDAMKSARGLGAISLFDNEYPPVKPWSRENDPKSLDVVFDDAVTFCIVSGEHFHIAFDRTTQRLVTWKVEPYGNAC